MLNVLIQNRQDTRQNPGGDTIQMDHTARFLRRIGCKVDVSFDLTPDLGAYDVVHLFNLMRPFETLMQAENARRQGKPYVLNTIYWDLRAAIPRRAHGFPHSLLRMLPASAWTWLDRARLGIVQAPGKDTCRSLNLRDIREIQTHILKGARLMIANSHAEKQHLAECFKDIRLDRIRVVMNGVTPVLLPNDRPVSRGDGNFLCAGAIGLRKNQLNAVRAFRQLPQETLVLLGQTAPGHQRYRRAVEQAAGPNVEFCDRIPHEEVREFMKQAKVYIQPSYIETPGLAAMEAAAAGIPIVVSDVRPVREYFGSIACYCDPASPDSIAEASRQALERDAGDGAEFARRFDWDSVLEPLESIYAELGAERLAVGA